MTTDTETSPQEQRSTSPVEKSRSSKSDKYEDRRTKRRRRSRERSPNQKRRRSSSRNRSRSPYNRNSYRRRREYRYRDLDKPDEYPRYYGNDDGNNDEENYSKNRHETVGSRYYDVESNKREKEKELRGESEKDGPGQRSRKPIDLLTSKTGGAYIPPAKLRMMQAEITDKTSAAYQRIAWEALKKSIHGHINKVNTSNIGIIARELLHENIVRGRGLLCRSLIQAQAASPTFTNVYSALVAVINSKFPNIGELLLKRLVLQFKRGFKQNNKMVCISSAAFIAHLVNQRVSHEILALEILTLLVESPTDDSVEVAISFLKECGQKLTEVSSKGKRLHISLPIVFNLCTYCRY